jgi:predicted membrane channel-forming protein YqfA (hemolysin III family)
VDGNSVIKAWSKIENMAEPNTTILSTGSALVTLATVAMGPLLGEYFIIIALGIAGTLLAMSEQNRETLFKSFVFLVRGILLSFIFTGIITTLIMKYLPEQTGLTAYALLGAVSFSIGWTSGRAGDLKNWLISKITKEKQD